jgi:hypothetical protein
MVIVLAIIAVGQTPQARAQQNLGSAGYMLPLCNAWLKIAEKDAEAIKNILRADPVRLTTAGMCAGEVIGIAETLRMLEMSCPLEGVTNEQIVRMAVNEIEKHPERLHEDFIVPVSAVGISGVMRLRPQQNHLASDFHGLLISLRLLQLRIVVVDYPAPYLSMPRRRLIRRHFEWNGSNIMSLHNGRAVQRAASRRVRYAYFPQRVTWLAPVAEN